MWSTSVVLSKISQQLDNDQNWWTLTIPSGLIATILVIHFKATFVSAQCFDIWPNTWLAYAIHIRDVLVTNFPIQMCLNLDSTPCFKTSRITMYSCGFGLLFLQVNIHKPSLNVVKYCSCSVVNLNANLFRNHLHTVQPSQWKYCQNVLVILQVCQIAPIPISCTLSLML